MYDQNFFLVANPIDRYALGSDTPGLTRNPDGSLDIYVQRTAPAGHRSNWLPVAGERPLRDHDAALRPRANALRTGTSTPRSPRRADRDAAGPAGPVVALRFDRGALWALDQTRLPWPSCELELRDADGVAEAIRRLAIRGAPLIGVAAGYGVALELARDPGSAGAGVRDARAAPARPRSTSPTPCAGSRAAATRPRDGAAAAAALAAASALHAEEERRQRRDRRARRRPARRRARRILTHCNTGALAAPGRGTALAVIAELAAPRRARRSCSPPSRARCCRARA